LAATPKVLLVGGTSHVGKSTLAARLSAELGSRLLSTDQLARHPGRPWRDDASPLPADVVAHFSSEPPARLLETVVEHYQQNVWPIVEAIVRSSLKNPYDPSLVFEGSAILPERVAAAGFEACEAVWLTASHDSIRERIRDSSAYATRSAEARRLIDAFSERAVAFDRLIVDTANRHGLRLLDVTTTDLIPEVLRIARLAPD